MLDLDAHKVEEWTDGSRMEGRAAAATRTTAKYLAMGTMSTIADLDAEALGVSLAWEKKKQRMWWPSTVKG